MLYADVFQPKSLSTETNRNNVDTIKMHDLKLLKMLLDMNANRSHENNKNMRAIDLAKSNRSTSEVVKLLRPV